MRKRVKKESKHISILFDVALYEQIKCVSELNNRSMSAQVRKYVTDGLKRLDENRQKAEI